MKISVVMQSYLGEYPGSRKHPEFKFTRAVQSFLSQQHLDRELVIVADGCDRTKILYEQLYSHHPGIKFVYVSKKNEKKTYEIEEKDGKTIKYYRGTPRRIGCSMVSGDIVTYMDSDDIMLPNRLSDLAASWKDKPDSVYWASNPLRYIHKNAIAVEDLTKKYFEGTVSIDRDSELNLRLFGYDIAEPFYINLMVPETHFSTATYALSHRSTIQAKWEDTIIIMENKNYISGDSEDTLFAKNLKMFHGGGFRQPSAAYVVCHYNKLWDV